jgi:hypothetical protein
MKDRVNVRATENQLSLARQRVADHPNEITAIPPLEQSALNWLIGRRDI